ncbi:hypothetical protein C5167_019828 [Papaver somniferum]|uniref:Peptidase A1 domain-containing protein n=1 Tax=Papaver somniferum TaxID=3469 RepID=A0A4Y7IR93_PAPSO|nr:basic 7S globulin-like [Papaver somniferum]RZC51393.1 hypothetical protein C5167_019828 [Papaver somniferum]
MAASSITQSSSFFTEHRRLLFFFLFLSLSNAQPSSSSRPHALVLPIYKDPTSLQYVIQINQRTPQLAVKLVVDLGGKFTWVHCNQSYISSKYRPVLCDSPQCSLASKCSKCVVCADTTPRESWCHNQACSIYTTNPITGSTSNGELSSDTVTLQSTNGSITISDVTVRQFAFGCETTTNVLEGLALGAEGMVGLGRSGLSLDSQFSAAFRFPRKFALCLSSGRGVIFFGDGPYMMQPGFDYGPFIGDFVTGIDISTPLSYTPLFTNPISTTGYSAAGEFSTDYFIAVKGIEVDGERVVINEALLSINKKNGIGGAKISTLVPYTTMETSIFKAFTSLYIKKAKEVNMATVPPVAPFNVCFNSSTLIKINPRIGVLVPRIDLVLPNNTSFGFLGPRNTMVRINDEVTCLGFVDGGLKPRTSIVIGGLQLEENLLQFDIPRSRLGFSSTLLFRPTSCSYFKSQF